MKVGRLLLLAITGLAFMVVLFLGTFPYREHHLPVFQNAPKLMAALQAFCRDHARRGQVPPDVSLRDLRYLNRNDVRAFEGLEVVFNPQATDTQPQSILARARMPDGQFVCLLADGSVQQFSASRFREALMNSSHPAGAENWSQPIPQNANQTSVAAGSGS